MSHNESQPFQVPWQNQAYSIKRNGTSINDCDAEPIHTPGCIQAHGALLVLRTSDLHILQVSENSMELLGVAPDALLGRTVAKALGDEAQEQLRRFLENEPLEQNPLYVFSFPNPRGQGSLDVSLHTIGGVAIVEIEETWRSLTTAEPDYYALLKTTFTRLHTAPSLQEFCDLITSEVKTLTGLDRVMVYRFHQDNHGEVYAESRRDNLPPWLGLHYPAEDIPKQVRDIFKKIWIRPLPDAHAQPVELIPLANPDTGLATDLTYCALRGASVMYTEYLCNMGVTASLTMPIRRDGELWGLISCHHYQPTHFSYQIRAACEFLAQAVSLQIKSVEDREQLLYRTKLDGVHGQLITATVGAEGKLETLIEGSPNLLNGLDATGAALFHHGQWWRCGKTPDEQELEALAEWLTDQPEFTSQTRPIYVTDQLGRDYSEAHRIADTAAGLLAVPLSLKHNEMMLWFRSEIIQTINWAGSPHDKPTVPGPNGPRLTPRVSFDLFVESVRGRSLPWKAVEIDAALRLRLWTIELIIVRNQRLADLNADLARSNYELDAFAYVISHDLKEPLRGIFNHTRKLLEDAQSFNEQQRQHLESLTRLNQRMDTLLNGLLRFSRIGRDGLKIVTTDLDEVLQEALKMVGLHRIKADIVVPRPLPIVSSDRARIREVFCCLIDNAIRYNASKLPKVEIGYIAPAESTTKLEGKVPVTTYYVRDNGIGIETQHLVKIFDLFRRLHGREMYGEGAGAGLSIVRMLVERHHGRVWAESKLGEGTTFYFTLGCEPGA